MKEIIKQLEEEKKRLELQAITINRIIGELKAMNETEIEKASNSVTYAMNAHKALTKGSLVPIAYDPKIVKMAAKDFLLKKSFTSKYNPEVVERMKQLHGTMSVKAMAYQLNREFRNLNATANSLSNYMSLNGITSGTKRPQGKTEGRGQKGWPKEVEDYIRNAVKTKNTLEICEGLKKFGINTNPDNLAKWMSKRKIKVLIRRKGRNGGRPKNERQLNEQAREERSNKVIRELNSTKVQAIEYIKTNSHMTGRKLKKDIKEKFKIGMDEEFIESQKNGEEMKQTSLVTPEIKRYVWNNREKPAQDLSTKVDAEFGVSLNPEDIITIKKARPIDFEPDEEEEDPSEGIIEEEMAGDEE